MAKEQNRAELADADTPLDDRPGDDFVTEDFGTGAPIPGEQADADGDGIPDEKPEEEPGEPEGEVDPASQGGGSDTTAPGDDTGSPTDGGDSTTS